MLFKLFRLSVRCASFIAPTRMARWAAKLFFTPRKRSTPEYENMPAADKEWAVEGAYLRRWGHDTACVFLLHGWEGRHSQFHALLPALREQGYSVLTIDPPGHGRCPGARSNPRLFAEALHAASNSGHQAIAVIGHSMGAAASMLATAQGLPSEALVLIAGPSNVRDVIAGFSHMIGLSPRATPKLMAQIEKEVGLPLNALDVAELASPGARPPALIIHDSTDRRIPPSNGHTITKHWPSSELITTDGLGHQRLLADHRVIARTLKYLESHTRHRVAA